MKKNFSNLNVMEDSPYLCILKIGLPLLTTCLLNIFIVLVLQKVYSLYAGDNYFLVIGLLSGITSSVPNIYTSVASAAWIKNAHKAVLADSEENKRSFLDGFYAIIIISTLLLVFLVAFSDVILSWLSIPTEIYQITKSYYILIIALYVFTGMASYCIAVVNGVCNVWTILFVNIVNVCMPLVMAFILLKVLGLGIFGASAVTGCAMLAVVLVCLTVLRKKGYKEFKRTHFVPRMKNITGIIGFGSVLALQSIFCVVGSFVLSFQANKYLNADYLSVLSLTIPITSVMNVFANVIYALIPVNYAAKKYSRVKKIFFGCLLMCVTYSLVCFSVYALFGRAYFSVLFTDKNIIEYGVSYWFWYGLGFIPVSVIFIVRIFFESIGKNQVALFSGVFEMTGMFICSFYIIPVFGEIGRSLGNTLGWTLAAIYLLTAYFVLRNKIYRKNSCKNK